MFCFAFTGIPPIKNRSHKSLYIVFTFSQGEGDTCPVEASSTKLLYELSVRHGSDASPLTSQECNSDVKVLYPVTFNIPSSHINLL